MLLSEKINSEEMLPLNLRTPVDLSVLANLESIQIAGEPDLIVELIDLYVEDTSRRLAVMRKSLAGSDWSSVKREAHGLRGSSGNLGAIRLALICEEIEGAEGGNTIVEVQCFIRRLELELGEVLTIFLRERQRRSQY